MFKKVYESSDSNEIKSYLAEKTTVFLVFANPSDEQIQPRYDEALSIIEKNNPKVWRVLWIKKPDQLDAELTKLFWPKKIPQAIVLSLGTGMRRTVKARYEQGEITEAYHVAKALSKG